jgi:aminoglycoside phosphotransferase (APT) family kinase protein
MSPLATLRDLVAAELARHAEALELTRESLRVEYVLNWGGFVNQSFRIDDGRRRYHLKLSGDIEGQTALRTWHRVHEQLTAAYHAPPVIDWIEVGGSSHAGLLFPWLDGTTPDCWSRELRLSVGRVVRALHVDRPLRDRVSPGPAIPSCAADYREDFHRRFVADLAIVAEQRPPFIDDSTFGWMGREVDRLTGEVEASTAFQRPADAPIHGDLWPANVLVDPKGRWYLLDWDDLRIGDPVLDLAKLFDQDSADGEAPEDEELAELIGRTPEVTARRALYARAVLLDRIIDPLADWVDADQAPEHIDQVRAIKQQEHRQALTRYRDRFATT